MKRKVALLSVLALFVCGSAFAQSAKFAAAWDDVPLIVESSTGWVCDGSDFDWDFDWTRNPLLATMKMPNAKEILAGISAESKIFLKTKVKGKLGGSGTAAGFGRVAVRVRAKNMETGDIFEPVPNGLIVLNARFQMLDATLGGVIEECTVGDDGIIDVGTECTVTDEEIGLLTMNASANHFNVVFVDLPQGTYEVRAMFTVLSLSLADADENACALAGSRVVLGDRIVTLQDVRAVKGAIDPIEIP